MAEIPKLTPTWKISFDLKPTEFSKNCFKNSANSIIRVKGEAYTGMPEIKFTCKQEKSLIEPACCSMYSIMKNNTACKRHGKHGWTKNCLSRSSANHYAKIKISHMIDGRFFRREIRKGLVIGNWHSFEMSQTREKYKNESRVMFKVRGSVQKFKHMNIKT